MKKKIFSCLAFTLLVGLTITSCSQEEDIMISANDPVTVDGREEYHYKMILNCSKPEFDDSATTRAVTNDWKDGTILYMRFRDGSKYVAGTATYSKSENVWNIKASSSLSISSGYAICELYYFDGDNGQTSTAVNMTERTACYFTTTAQYSHPSEMSISVNAVLDRKTWRLRFKGAKGTTISLPGSDNDIKYFSSFNKQTGDFSSSRKDITLTVNNDGYTPYIYGTFVNSFGENALTLNNMSENITYEKTEKLTTSDLKVGESAVLTIPTENSHIDYGWLITKYNYDSNAWVEPDILATFTDGIVMTFKAGSTMNNFCFIVMANDELNDPDNILDVHLNELSDVSICELIYMVSDNGLIGWLRGGGPYTKVQAQNYKFKSLSLTEDTEYILYLASKNEQGRWGPLTKYPFKTKSSGEPIAEITDIKAVTTTKRASTSLPTGIYPTTTKWTYKIDLKNNAKEYYLLYDFLNENDEIKDWHWYAFDVYQWVKQGKLKSETNKNGETKSMEEAKNVIICTWALDSQGNICNCDYAYGTPPSSTKSRIMSAPKIEAQSNDRMMKLRNNTTIYRIEH